jgi:hypothetical protein
MILHSKNLHVCISDYRRGFANFHNLQSTITHANSFPARSVFTSSCLVMASNNGCYSLNGGSLPTACLPYNWLVVISHRPSSVLFTAYQLSTLATQRNGPRRKHRSSVACVFVAAGLCLPNRSLATAVY